MSDERDDAIRAEMQYLASVLVGLSFPAKRWQIIAWASYNGAGLGLVGALQEMPEIPYRNVGQVARELEAVRPGWW